MKRTLLKSLLSWKSNTRRKPLLVRGARQVGKSYLIEHFGKTHFKQLININLELEPSYHACFSSLDPQEVCRAIAVVSKQPVTPHDTLLFLDEIQECPEAIRSLRYFKEKMPDLHVIAAGSLLELALNDADYRMPVGRVSSLYLKPLSFKEFLMAINPQAVDAIESATLEKPLSLTIHEYLLKQLKLYLHTGGMPEAIAEYQITQNLLNVQKVQADIFSTYEKDFGHYAAYTKVNLLRRCFYQVPYLIGQQIKYNKIDSDTRSRDLKIALEKLHEADLLQPVRCSSAGGLPLDASINEKKFKLNFVDIGLVTRACRIDAELTLEEDFMLLNRGTLAEQFVGQELSAYSEDYEATKLYFWAKDGHSIAEIDYLYTFQNQIFPIEVKAGKIGRLKSLLQFLKDKQCPLGIRISQLPLQKENQILSVPLYMISELNRLLM